MESLLTTATKLKKKTSGQHNWVARVFLTRHNLVALGGLCYYFGDNLPPLIEYYRNELNCKPECVEVIQLIGAFTLGFADTSSMFLWRFVELLITKPYGEWHPLTVTQQSHDQ